jgi:hypothetical protein
MQNLKEEDIISLINEKKMSFIDILYYLYLKDVNEKVDGVNSPQWLNSQQQKWIREAFNILNKASDN